jgi:hypothetical protein
LKKKIIFSFPKNKNGYTVIAFAIGGLLECRLRRSIFLFFEEMLRMPRCGILLSGMPDDSLARTSQALLHH